MTRTKKLHLLISGGLVFIPNRSSEYGHLGNPVYVNMLPCVSTGDEVDRSISQTTYLYTVHINMMMSILIKFTVNYCNCVRFPSFCTVLILVMVCHKNNIIDRYTYYTIRDEDGVEYWGPALIVIHSGLGMDVVVL